MHKLSKLFSKIFFVRFATIFLSVFLVMLLLFFGFVKNSKEWFLIYFYECRNLVLKKENTSEIGWITDIHADRFKRRSVDSGTIYPRKYDEYLIKVFNSLRKKGINVVIASGDNTNSGDINYAIKVRLLAAKENMKVIWVRGNHDSNETMNVLGVKNEKYYFNDYDDVRIIVLDNADNSSSGNYLGSVDDKQLKWLNEALKTPKKVIVTMHIPLFFKDEFVEKYSNLEEMMKKSGNVKIVLSGHYHVPFQKQYDGIDYYTEGALTYSGAEGAYGIINTREMKVEYLFAK